MVNELSRRLPGLASPSTLHEIVLYLIECVQNGTIGEFESFFAFVEDRIIFSEPDVRDTLIVELLEDLKNQASLRDLDYAIFENWLGRKPI